MLSVGLPALKTSSLSRITKQDNRCTLFFSKIFCGTPPKAEKGLIHRESFLVTEETVCVSFLANVIIPDFIQNIKEKQDIKSVGHIWGGHVAFWCDNQKTLLTADVAEKE